MKRFFAPILLLLSSLGHAAEPLVMGVSHLPPHFTAPTGDGVGIQLIREAFRRMPDHDVSFRFMSINRGLKEFTQGRLQAAANVFEEVEACASDPFIYWRDVAITLKKNKLRFQSASDLGQYTVVSFQGAKAFLGPEFRQMADANPNYYELGHEEALLKMLLRGRADVWVGDYLTFLYFLNDIYGNRHSADEFDTFPIIDDYTRVVFKDVKLCQQFNEVIAEMRKDGSYQAMYDKQQQQLIQALKH